MNKLGLIYLSASALLGFSYAEATTVQVGEINGFTQNAVMNLSESQYEVIFPAERLSGFNGACMIDELAFPYVHSETGGAVSGEYTAPVKIYLENTTDAEVGMSSFYDVSKMTLVYDGTTSWYGGSEEEPNWNSYTLETPFQYTGRNLRLVYVKDADIYSNVEFGYQMGWNIPYLMQIGYGGTYTPNPIKRLSNVVPVTRFDISSIGDTPTLTSDKYNWAIGDATIGETYTQEITVTGRNLTGNVTVTTEKGLVQVTPNALRKSAVESGATITLTLTPADDQATEDNVTISSPNCDDIVLKVTWTPKWKKPDATISVNPTSVEFGDTPINQTTTKSFEITTTGTLYNGIAISAPTTNIVKVTPLSFTNEELAGGKVTVSVEINPEGMDISSDKIILSSRGMDDIEVPIKWNPVLGYDAVVTQLGESNDYSQKVPLFSTWEASESEMIYRAKDLKLKKGAKIRRITYPITFNSNAVEETITLSLANTTDKVVGNEFTENMTQVAYVTKTIPAGGNIDQATPFYYLNIDLPEAFVYDGSNLRVRIKGVSSEVSQRWYFSNDSRRKGEMPIIVRAAENEAELANCSIEAKTMQRTNASFPVTIFTSVDESTHSESQFTLDSYSWVNGESALNHTYTQEVTVNAENLKGDITISTPSNSAVTVEPTVITKADAEAGTAKFTISLNATDLTSNYATFKITSEGADVVEYPIFWTPNENVEEPGTQAGEITGWEAYTPFDLTSQQGHCEFVYRAADLNLDGSNKYIKEIAYPYYHFALHGDADPFTSKITVYVENTSATDVPTDDEDFTDVSTMTKVFDSNITFDGGSKSEPTWANIPFDEKFLYTGGNLRIVCLHDCTEIENISDQASFNKFYFAQDTAKAAQQYCLYTYDNEIRYNTGRHYPVVSFILEDAPTVRLDVANWEVGNVEVGKTYTKTINVSASGLLGDIIISDPNSSEITLDEQLISMESIQTSGSASITLTLTPTENSTGKDSIEIFTEGGETIEFPITWTLPGSVGSMIFDHPQDVTVFDVLGRHVLDTRIEGNIQTNLEKVLNQGIYIVKAGNNVYKLKINK